MSNNLVSCFVGLAIDIIPENRGIALFVCKLPKIKVLEQKRGSLLTLPSRK